VTPAAWVALGALIITALTTYLTFGPIRRELKTCERERSELRRNLQFVVAAIIGTLPREKRIELLAKVDEWVLPREAA